MEKKFLAERYGNFVDSYEKTFEIYNKAIFHCNMSLFDLNNCENLLDLGCGNGSCEEVILKSYSNLKITGIDLSKPMISRACSRNLANCEFIQLDCCDLPFPSEHFDRVLANFIINNVSNPCRLVSEAYRVLKPRGLMFLSFPLYKSSNDVLKIMQKALRSEKIGPKEFKAEEFVEICRGTGFKDVRCLDASVGLNLATGGEVSEFLGPLREVAKLKKMGKYEAVVESIRKMSQEVLDDGQVIVLEARVVLAYK